jgi:ABC-2 type transport system permease protein
MIPHPLHTPFFAVFRTEVLLNAKRLAPYVTALLCGGNALLWWGWGPATGRGLATNSDAFIGGVLPVFSFMTPPLFTAVIMADPVIRDFRDEIDPLIFSKPVGRASYLLGKFLGSFFVLSCGQSAFVITLFVLQWFSRPGMVVQDVKVVPYFKHFVVLVAISHLFLAAIYFAAGTLTRNAKLVYALGVCFYPVYSSYQLFVLKGLPLLWRRVLDPLLMNWGQRKGDVHRMSAEEFNKLVFTYDAELFINRAIMLLIVVGILTLVYRRFIIAERPQKVHFSFLNLSTASERISFEPEPAQDYWVEQTDEIRRMPLALPSVSSANSGIRESLRKLLAALAIEFRLLLSERSLVAVIPFAVLLSTMEVIFWTVRPVGSSYSAGYLSNIAGNLLLFMIGISIFYTGEALQRDRDLKIESLVWSQPIPNFVLLFSKFLATLLLVCTLLVVVGLIAVVTQTLKRHGPVELFVYLRVYFWILIPNAIFLTAAATFLKVFLRDRYLTYTTAIGIGGGLFYLYSQGHRGWPYNPLLFRLWTYEDLQGGDSLSRIAKHRAYVLITALVLLALTHLFYQRRSTARRVRF